MRILTLIAVLCLSLSSHAAIYGGYEFCEAQGYDLVEHDDSTFCQFDDGTSCDFHEFYNGNCGAENQRAVECAQLGDHVWPEFQECCQGEPFLESNLVGQTRCEQPKRLFDFNRTTIGFVLIVLVMMTIILILKRVLLKRLN